MKLNDLEKQHYIDKINESLDIAGKSKWILYLGEGNIDKIIVAVFDKIASPLIYLKKDLDTAPEPVKEKKLKSKIIIHDLTKEDLQQKQD